MTTARLNNNSGFTLIEILIAVSIMSILLVGLYMTFFSVSAAGVRIESELEQTRQLRRFMDIIQTELHSSFYKASNDRTLFEGGFKGHSGRERSSLGFTWFGYPRLGRALGPDSRPASELIAVRYYIKEATGEGGEYGAVLYKTRWNPYEKEGAGYSAEVMENVQSFALSYFDGKDWVSGWDASRSKKLPAAVKIELTLRDAESSQLYSSIVRISMEGKVDAGGVL